MVAIELERNVCHTEVIEDDCGFRLANVCHDEPRLWGLRDSYICSQDDCGVECEEIAHGLRADDCGCLCC